MQWVELKWSTTQRIVLVFYRQPFVSFCLKVSYVNASLCVFRLVEMAAKSIQQELQKRVSQEDAWNNSAIDLVRASDVSYLTNLGYGMCCFLGGSPPPIPPISSPLLPSFNFLFVLSLVLI